MTEGELDALYFEWLYERLGRKKVSHRRLFSLLYSVRFVWKVKNDDNRVKECQRSRSEHLLRVGAMRPDHREWAEQQPTVLEMLYQLSCIMEFETILNRYVWFWHLLDNLELSDLNDEEKFQDDQVIRVAEMFVNRTYTKTGEGGAFPMEHTQVDQRKVELWYQLNEYLLEDRFRSPA